jgi:UDP-glucose 4-epimerase
LEAEQALLKLAKETGLEVVIIRPPLVYGPGVKANFQTMMRWIAKGVPLPFGALDNQRSLVALDNLVSFIITCLLHPAAVNQVFLVSDGDDMSVTEILRCVRDLTDAGTLLVPFPKIILKIAGYFLNRTAYADRILSSLQVDASKCRSLLGWSASVSVNTALREVVLDSLNT